MPRAQSFPPGVHDDDDVRAWVAGWDLTAYDVWLATDDAGVAGYARWTLDVARRPLRPPRAAGCRRRHRVVRDGERRTGPEGFCLWVFESNAPARRFYRRRGCLELERTDGAANEEGAPDIRVAWPGQATRSPSCAD